MRYFFQVINVALYQLNKNIREHFFLSLINPGQAVRMGFFRKSMERESSTPVKFVRFLVNSEFSCRIQQLSRFFLAGSTRVLCPESSIWEIMNCIVTAFDPDQVREGFSSVKFFMYYNFSSDIFTNTEFFKSFDRPKKLGQNWFS